MVRTQGDSHCIQCQARSLYHNTHGHTSYAFVAFHILMNNWNVSIGVEQNCKLTLSVISILARSLWRKEINKNKNQNKIESFHISSTDAQNAVCTSLESASCLVHVCTCYTIQGEPSPQCVSPLADNRSWNVIYTGGLRAHWRGEAWNVTSNPLPPLGHLTITSPHDKSEAERSRCWVQTVGTGAFLSDFSDSFSFPAHLRRWTNRT